MTAVGTKRTTLQTDKEQMRQNGLQQAKICRYFTVIANLKKKLLHASFAM